ncbi:MAG: hypothetical protein JSS49_24430 [Planctomycetes bacterium]|nr:hypothetical protein [Planctomycetota bacterium]
MKLEHVQLAIRPRNILECLDIAFLFCGRNWVGLLGASLAGIVPIFLLNLLLQSWFEPVNVYFGLLLLSMEVPWATLLLTLYLGQITFSKKFSSRRAARDVGRTFPQMVCFQVLVRGLCMLLCVAAPIVFVEMFFLNEIILLEQTSLKSTWARRTALNARTLGKIVALRLIDLVVLCFGMVSLTILLRTVSELWEDRFRFDPEAMLDTAFVVDWQIQAAFWIAITFLTVFRFVSYLDCRIRREGWDVELKLRAQARQYAQQEIA